MVMEMPKRKIIAIDGPSGAGKSTVARLLAERLGYIFIDTGAMYRAIAWKAKKEGVPLNEESLKIICSTTEINLKRVSGRTRVFVDDKDVTEEIRTPEIGMMASTVSAFPCVRERLLELQRSMGRNGGIVMEGRDIGTVIFPDAEIKFFLDATIDERGKRRHLDLLSREIKDEPERVTEEIKKRDEADSKRALAPLRRADDSIYIDSTKMSMDDVIEVMLKEIERSTTRRDEDDD
jgi:cytidylate kinase